MKNTRFGPSAFVWSLAGLGVLPVLPEIMLAIRANTGLKAFRSTGYYECMVSFLLLAPALVLPERASKFWLTAYALLLLPATLIADFYVNVEGARWNVTAHTALLETNSGEAWGYVRSFVSFEVCAWILFFALAFAGCLFLNLHSRPPLRRTAWFGIACGILLSSYGVGLAIRYVKHPFERTTSESVRVFGAGPIERHPLLLMAGMHYNYYFSRQYYMKHYREAATHFGELEGATGLPGAVSPRIGVVVVGESANRRHWSLYGYRRDTTPLMRALSNELFIFRDVISSSVGTVASIRGMMTRAGDSTPVFHLFSGAGYRTHWISSRTDSEAELQLSALVESCDDRIYLGGAYDEQLLAPLSRALAAPGRQMIFLNLTGSHVRYSDGYPARQEVFQGGDEAGKLVAAYDNSIHYTDYVLSRVIAELKSRNEASFLVYFSDHGEDVYDSRPDRYLFRDNVNVTNPMVEVPFIVWFSPRYVAENREFISSRVAGSVRHAFQNQELYHSLIALLRLSHPIYDSSKDLFSPDFRERDRRMGDTDKIYRGDNPL